MKISIKEFNMEATVEDIQKITEKKSNDADIWAVLIALMFMSNSSYKQHASPQTTSSENIMYTDKPSIRANNNGEMDGV